MAFWLAACMGVMLLLAVYVIGSLLLVDRLAVPGNTAAANPTLQLAGSLVGSCNIGI